MCVGLCNACCCVPIWRTAPGHSRARVSLNIEIITLTDTVPTQADRYTRFYNVQGVCKGLWQVERNATRTRTQAEREVRFPRFPRFRPSLARLAFPAVRSVQLVALGQCGQAREGKELHGHGRGATHQASRGYFATAREPPSARSLSASTIVEHLHLVHTWCTPGGTQGQGHRCRLIGG